MCMSAWKSTDCSVMIADILEFRKLEIKCQIIFNWIGNESIMVLTNMNWILQGFKGIWQWPINWYLIPDGDIQNHPICRLQLQVETFGLQTYWTNQ